MNLQKIDIRSALTRTPPALDFVLPGLLARSIGAVVAPGGAGKSFLELQIAVAIGARLPIAGGLFPAPEKSGKVVIIAGEDTGDVLARRLHDIGNDLKQCDDEYNQAPLLGSKSFNKVIDAIDANVEIYPLAGTIAHLVDARGEPTKSLNQIRTIAEGARLVIIDPLRRFHTGDENDSGHMTRLVQILESVSLATGCTILIAHQTNKVSTLSGNGNLQQAIRGSSALTDAIRWQANLVGMTGAEAGDFGIPANQRNFYQRFEISKCNYAQPADPVWLRRTEGGVLVKVDLNRSGGSSKRRGRVDND